MLVKTSRKFFFLKAAWFVTILILSLASIRESRADISTYAVLQELGQKEYKLQFKLVNDSDKKISLSLGLLPWAESVWNGLILIAVEAGGKQELIPRYYHFSNPVGHIEINPKQQVTGDISLANVFPSLNNVLSHSDVLIFWSYQLPKQSEMIFKRSGGWVLIKKK